MRSSSPTWSPPPRVSLAPSSPTPLPPLPSDVAELIPDCFDDTPNNQVFCNRTLIIDTQIKAPNGQPILISRPQSDLVGASDGLSDVDSPIVNITLAQEGEDGVSQRLGGHIEICLRPFEMDRQHCLGYLDESRRPPEWRCQDVCLQEKSGLMCGRTDHLTAFALLLTLELPHGRSPCSAFTGYVTGTPYGDMGLILGTAALMVVLGVCLCLAVNIPHLRTLILGSEGDRIARSRVARRKMSQWLVASEDSTGSDEMVSSTSQLLPPC